MKRFYFILLLLLFLIPCNAKGANFAFSATPNNVNKKDGYFKYNINISQKKTVSITLKNYSNKELKINNYINDAHNDNGSISYNLNKNDNYKKINKNLKSMIVGNNHKKVTIKPHKSKKVYFTFKIPKEGIQGVVLGAINSVPEDGDSGKNKVQYSNAILLQSDVKRNTLKKLSIDKIVPSKNKIKLYLLNDQSSIAENYKMKLNIFSENKDKVVSANKNYGMVPNSKEKYELNYDSLKSGSYVANIKLIDQNGNYKKYNKYFEVGQNYKKVSKKSYLWLFILVVILTFIYYLLVLLIRKIKITYFH